MVSLNGSSALVWDAERLRIASGAAGIALWSWNVDTDEIALDQRAHDLWEAPVSHTAVTFEALSAKIHPEDIGHVKAAFAETRTKTGPYEIDFRILHDHGAVRWISARGQSGDTGMLNRVMFGIFMDVTDRKLAEEAREMLAGEMSHRVKNLFSLASALTELAARSAATTEEMARDLTGRLTALGHAHDLVRSVPGEESKALLGDLLGVLLAPYSQRGGAEQRITVAVPPVPVGQTTATTLALVMHELATNSVKYGALSDPNGTLNVSCTTKDDDLIVLWQERGGPPISAPIGPEGFGSRLIARSVSGQLGGSIAFEWPSSGAIVTLRMSKARLAR